jgi:hypothetical protein
MKLKISNEMYPTKSVIVPSKNKFYEGLDETFQFEVRSMTVQEQKALLAMNANNVDDTILKIVRSCVTNIDISQLDLLIMDRDYLLYEIRQLTYGEDLTIDFTCSNCGEKNEVVSNLSLLDIKYIEEPKEEVLNRMKYQSKYIIDEETNEPIEIQFFFPTVKSVREMNMLMKSKKNSRDMMIYTSIVSSILSINGEPVSFQVKKDLLNLFMNLPANEITEITKLLKHDYGVQQTVTHTCGVCGTENEVGILNVDFFFPTK